MGSDSSGASNTGRIRRGSFPQSAREDGDHETDEHNLARHHGAILKRERKFVAHLVNISRKLGEMKHDLCPKDELKRRLVMELTNMNFNLPGRLWLPGVCDGEHHVVRIPPGEALLLNSKERVPYLIYVEIV